VGNCCRISGKRLEEEIARWVAVGGGTDRDGNEIKKPKELEIAELVDALCEKYGKLPSEIYSESSELLRINTIVHLGKKEEKK
jgi:hypothetical protein